METGRFRILALTIACAALPAAAQGVGFFRPAADPALTTTRPQAQAQPQQAPAAPAGPSQPPAAPVAAVPTAPQTPPSAPAELADARQADSLRWAEQQMNRAEAEADRAREQTAPQPAGIGASFTGSTSERDR